MALRVMTWNILRDDGGSEWPRRLEGLLQGIAREAPDILALQEATAPQLRDLHARLPGYDCVPGSQNSHGEHPALLFRPERARLADAGCVWLSDTPEVPMSRSWGNDIARCASWALFRTREGELLVVNAHFDHESEEFREEAAYLLETLFPGALLLGDFNATPDSEPHRILTLARRDVAPARGMETMPLDADHGGPDARYDWILVPEGYEAEEVHRVGEPFDGVAPSDHYGLSARIEARRIDE